MVVALRRQLARNNDDVEYALVPSDGKGDWGTDSFADQQALQLRHCLHRLTVDGDDQVAGGQPCLGGRRFIDDLPHLNAAGAAKLAREPRRQR